MVERRCQPGIDAELFGFGEMTPNVIGLPALIVCSARAVGRVHQSGPGVWNTPLEGRSLMALKVVVVEGSHRLEGEGSFCDLANGFLAHLEVRAFAGGTVRGYAFDLLNFGRFLDERGIMVGEVVTSDLFDWLEWQQAKPKRQSGRVVQLESRGAAPSTVNRRVAAVQGMFEYAVVTGARVDNPVPPGRRSMGLRARRRGALGHLGGRRPRNDGRLVRQDRRLPESLEAADVAAFVADLETHRDRAVVLAMLLGGLRAAEVRSLLLANVDVGMRRLRVRGKGGRERVVPVDQAFFTELVSYLRLERPPGCATPECFVVLRGPTRGQAMTEAGCGRCSAFTPPALARPGCGLTGYATPMAPSWLLPVSTCWCCVS